MFRSIIIAMLMVFAVPVFAQSAPPNPCANIAESTRGKNSTEIATILESCRGSGGILPDITPEKATEWSHAAKGFAEAFGIAARELGIATNDFLLSPAGFLLAAIILFNYAGGALIGFPFTIFSVFVLLWMYKRMSVESVEYESFPILWGALTLRRKKKIVQDSLNEANAITLIIATLVMLVMNLFVWVNVT